MIYLVAIFLPPLYFLSRKRWGGFIISSLLCFFGLVTMIMGIGLVFYGAAIAYAVFNLRMELSAKQAELIAERTAAKLKEQETANQPGKTA